MSETIITITGEFVKVSNEDFECLRQFRWRMHSRGYSQAYIEGQVVLMHRLVLERKLGRKIKANLVTDHINENKLDNRRENLRELTPFENASRSNGKRENSTSQFRGVCKAGRRWRVLIRIGGKVRAFGTYATEDEAAMIYPQITGDRENWQAVWEGIQKRISAQ